MSRSANNPTLNTFPRSAASGAVSRSKRSVARPAPTIVPATLLFLGDSLLLPLPWAKITAPAGFGGRVRSPGSRTSPTAISTSRISGRMSPSCPKRSPRILATRAALRGGDRRAPGDGDPLPYGRLRLRDHALRLRPPRPRVHLRPLRRAGALSPPPRRRGRARAERHRRGRRHPPGVQGARGGLPGAGGTRGGVLRACDARHQRDAAHSPTPGDPVRAADDRRGRAPARRRPRLRTAGNRVLPGGQRPRIRPPLTALPRGDGAARGRTRRPPRGSEQGRPPRLRPVAGVAGRRARVGEPLGEGPSRVAHRVLDDGPPSARAARGHPRWRLGPHL